MDIRTLHPWDVPPAEAIALQKRLAAQVIAQGGPQDMRYVAGADIAFADRALGRQPSRAVPAGRQARGAVVLLSYPDLRLLETVVVEVPVTFPYIPGLLAFREVPVLAQAFQKLQQRPDLVIADGHGYSHPRRFGFACHLGLVLDLPTIGCAKSRLTGEHADPPDERGGRAELRDADGRGGLEVIGLVLRTRQGVNPVYVSVGHRIGLQEAADWVLRLCQGYRLPEPTRLADQLAGGKQLQPSAAPAGQQQRLF